jgi:hypothetical protein
LLKFAPPPLQLAGHINFSEAPAPTAIVSLMATERIAGIDLVIA